MKEIDAFIWVTMMDWWRKEHFTSYDGKNEMEFFMSMVILK